MNTITKHGIVFFRFFANERWGLRPEYKGEEIDFETILDPKSGTSFPDESYEAKLFLWHRNYGYVSPEIIGNNITIGQAIEKHLTNDYDSKDRDLTLRN